MKQDIRSGTEPRTDDRIRRLGFDPAHLTPAERRELLELQRVLAGPQPLPA